MTADTLNDAQYDGYLATILDLEGVAGVRQEAERQRATVYELERRLHRLEAESAIRQRQRDLEIRALHLEAEALEVRLTLKDEMAAHAISMQQHIRRGDFYCPCEQSQDGWSPDPCPFYE